jgi:hypothetical protein
MIVACICTAIVLCVGLIFVEASADNIETVGGLIREAKPPTEDVGKAGRGKLEPP